MRQGTAYGPMGCPQCLPASTLCPGSLQSPGPAELLLVSRISRCSPPFYIDSSAEICIYPDYASGSNRGEVIRRPHKLQAMADVALPSPDCPRALTSFPGSHRRRLTAVLVAAVHTPRFSPPFSCDFRFIRLCSKRYGAEDLVVDLRRPFRHRSTGPPRPANAQGLAFSSPGQMRPPPHVRTFQAPLKGERYR
jgi:hypothetical protein